MQGMKTSRIFRPGLLAGVGVLLLAPGLAQAVSLSVGTPTGAPGTQVTFSVSLNAEGANINGVQNDIAFDSTNTPVAVRTMGNCSVTTTQSCSTDADCPDLQQPFTGKEPCVNVTSAPDCAVNSSINKGGFFSFLPSGCTGTACTGLRAVIIALDNTDAIPDGPLYSCTVDISPDATLEQSYPLTLSGAVASDTSFRAACSDAGGSAPACGSTDGSVTASTASPIFVCDVAPSTGDNAGEFGSGTINNSDIVAIFKASLLGPPPSGTARFSGMDSITEDSPPTCGGDGSIRNNDVVACFKRSLLPTLPRYDRSGVGGSCTSSLHQ